MQYDEWMSASDAIVWHIERDPVLRSTVTAIWFFDRPPEPDRFERSIDLLIASVPRLRQRVVADPMGIASPRWIEAAGFDPADHVHHHDLASGTISDGILDTASELHTRPFDKSRPLWEMHLFTGLDDGRAAMVVKIHHAIADGLGLVGIAAALVQGDRDAEPAAFRGADRVSSEPVLPHLVDAVVHRVEHDARLAARAGVAVGRNLFRLAWAPFDHGRQIATTGASIGKTIRPAKSSLSPVMTERSRQFQLTRASWGLDEFRAAARSMEASINDIFLAGLTGGLGAYHLLHRSPVDQLRVQMPVSTRAGGDETVGNQFVPARFLVPANIADPAERVRALSALLKAERSESGLGFLDQTAEVVQRLGPVAATQVLSGMLKAVDFVASNVPGNWGSMYVAGAKVEELVPYGPCVGAALNATLLSYDGRVTVGITSDQAAIPDPEVLTRSISEGIDEVLRLAG